MTSKPDAVLQTFKAVHTLIERSSTDALKAVPIFFLQRLSLLCIDTGFLTLEAHDANLDSYLSMIATPDKEDSQRLAVAAELRAMNAGADDETIEVGYFSMLCYAHRLLLTGHISFARYTCDVYLGWIEAELADGALANELANMERLMSRVSAQVEWTAKAYRDVRVWALSAPIGERLSALEQI